MMNDTFWLDIFAKSEEKWSATNTSDSEKLNAWRVQKLILAHATRTLSEKTQYAVLNDHQSKMETASCLDSYMQNRLDGCLSLLGRNRRPRNGAKPVVEWSTPLQESFERPCHGVYESCKHRECVIKTGQKPKEKITNDLRPSKETQTARWESMSDDLQIKKYKQDFDEGPSTSRAAAEMSKSRKKSLGGRGRGVNSKFVSPIAQTEVNESEGPTPAKQMREEPAAPSSTIPASLAQFDESMVKQIMADMRDHEQCKSIAWEDVAGLEYAKSTFMETIIHPLQRPDLFKGVRRPPRGVLLFGPPGTGKTLIAKCIASQSKAAFLSIHPSTLTSKWVGEGEKLVKTLFAVAREYQPSIIFLDEVDSLLSQRSDREHESSRRMKNEFFIHLDGAATNEDDNIIIIGATNRPEELDEAVRRRFARRLYIPLPDKQGRQKIIENLLNKVDHQLTTAQIERIAELTEGYSGADMCGLCKYAAMQPIRTLSCSQMKVIEPQQLQAVTMEDFETSLQHVPKSVSPDDVKRYVSWNEIYGVKQ